MSCPDGSWGSPPSCSCVEDNTAYFGNNARVGSSNPQPSRAACARSCREHPECQFWTWGKGSPMGPCYLKHSRDNVSPGLTSYVSGSKLCVLPESEGKPEELIGDGKNLVTTAIDCCPVLIFKVRLHGFPLHVLIAIVKIGCNCVCGAKILF